MTLLPSGIGNSEYDAAGYVCIGEEIIGYTRSGDTLTLTERAAKGTTIKTHDLDDLVQKVLTFAPGRCHDHVFTLLCNYTSLGNAGSPTGSSKINKAPYLLVRSRRVSRKPGSGGTSPMLAAAGSTMIAAIRSG